jgi:hypothetical protein
MLLAEVIADLALLPASSTIHAESLGPSARALVVVDGSDAAESFPYVVDVGAAQAALGRGAPCPWVRRRVSRAA